MSDLSTDDIEYLEARDFQTGGGTVFELYGDRMECSRSQISYHYVGALPYEEAMKIHRRGLSQRVDPTDSSVGYFLEKNEVGKLPITHIRPRVGDVMIADADLCWWFSPKITEIAT